MKNLFLFTILLISTTVISAQKVALHSTSGIQHFIGTNGFSSAYAAAIPGDTIYLPGGGFTSPVSIDKQLYVFGAGHYPDSTQATAKTYLNGGINLSENADGFLLEGVDINGQLQFDYNESVNNVIVKYCKMTQIDFYGNNTFTNASNNVTFINNVITGNVILSNGQNVAMYNNMIGGRVYNSSGNLYENNIFLYNNSSYLTFSGDNNIINNCIFLISTNLCIYGVSNQINNNIFINGSPHFGTTPIASGNYYPVAHNTIFINQTGYVFDYSHDYHLQSPTTYIGVDNTEVGLYGGFNGYKEGAVPSNPHIQFKNIAPTTNTNGFLNIQINAAAQDK